MVIHSYQDFFELLRQFYEQDIELYFERTGFDSFPSYEQTNCFEQLWLRATPEDFTDPEQFLKKSVILLKDHTLDKYNKETSDKRKVIDFIAGMTDELFFKEIEK